MKVEQACRFRLDEGYSIFGKSAGFQPAHEDALGKFFNSARESVFPKVGSAVLSCKPDKDGVFFAKSTLRTDILGRNTIFTHSYIFDFQDYATCMETDPQLVLAVSMDQLLDSQVPGAQMDSLEVTAPSAQSIDPEKLFEKYHLTPSRYSKLLLGVYEALTSNSSLCLKTNLPIEQTGAMVQEMMYCILEGVLPALRGRISYSSAMDTSLTVSVIPREEDSRPTGIVFGVEDDGYSNIRPKDEISALAFEALGKASREERRELLQKMQDWLSEVTNVREGVTLMLVSMAYCMSSDKELSLPMLLTMFQSITKSKSISNLVANGLLTVLVKRMNDTVGCNTKAHSQIAGWYLKDSTPRFREEAERSLNAAPVETCGALVEACMNQEMTDNVRQMLHCLLKRVPANAGILSPETQNKVVLWILGENVEALSEYAGNLVMNYQDDQILPLVQGILENSTKRLITKSEDVMLTKSLGRLIQANIRLSNLECDILDRISPYYSDLLMGSALKYLFYIRFRNNSLEDNLDLLEKYADKYRRFFTEVLKWLMKGVADSSDLYENFRAKTCFREGMGLMEIENICKTANVFNNPMGVFEQRVGEYVLALIRAEFLKYESSAQIRYYTQVLIKNWIDVVRRLNISNKMRQKLAHDIIACFWETVSYIQIFDNDVPLQGILRNAPPEYKRKLDMMDLVLSLRNDPLDTKLLIKQVTSEYTKEDQRELLILCSKHMLKIYVDKNCLYWDFALLTCWVQTEEGGNVDLDRLVSLVKSIEKSVGRSKYNMENDASNSLLLMQDDKLAKSICKLGNDAPDLIKNLIEQLKSRKKGLFSNLFGSSRDKKADPRYKGKNPADNKATDSAYVFDPTFLDNFDN